MVDQFGDRSQEATPHRRQQARREGRVPKSHDLTSAVLLLTALISLLYCGRGIVTYLRQFAEQQLGQPRWQAFDHAGAVELGYSVIAGLAWAMLPVFVAIFVVAVLCNLLQVGFLFLPQRLALDLSRVDPIRGVSRVLSLNTTARLGFGLFKIAVIAGVAFASLYSQRQQVLACGSLEAPQLALFLASIVFWTCIKIGLALLLLAIVDYLFQRWKHERDLRMTPHEVREEMKQLQGDPQLVARRRAVQRELVLNRLGTVVPTADVVITHPGRLAVAIRYQADSMDAPVVVAKGSQAVADRICRLANQNQVPLYEQRQLATQLDSGVELNEAIPAEYYRQVARVIQQAFQERGVSPPLVESTP